MAERAGWIFREIEEIGNWKLEAAILQYYDLEVLTNWAQRSVVSGQKETANEEKAKVWEEILNAKKDMRTQRKHQGVDQLWARNKL